MSGTDASIIKTQNQIMRDQAQTIKELDEALDKADEEAIKMGKKLVAYENRDKKQEDYIEHLRKVRDSLMDKIAVLEKKLEVYEPKQGRYTIARGAEALMKEKNYRF